MGYNTYSDPHTEKIINITGGESVEGNAFSNGQVRALRKLYEFKDEVYDEITRSFMEAGDLKNLFRHTKRDGYRMMAIIAKFCDAGEDPVKVMVKALADQGYDVGELADWANEP